MHPSSFGFVLTKLIVECEVQTPNPVFPKITGSWLEVTNGTMAKFSTAWRIIMEGRMNDCHVKE